MKRYRFRLAQVLRVRRIERDRAAGAIAHARIQHESARRHTAAMEHEYGAITAPEGDSSLAEFRGYLGRVQLAADAVVVARQVESSCRQVLQQRLAEWAETDKRVRLLEELDERSRQRHAAEVLIEEQHQLDDLVTSRAGRAH